MLLETAVFCLTIWSKSMEKPDPQPEAASLVVRTLGPATFPSPLKLSTVEGDGVARFVPNETRVLFDIVLPPGESVPGSLVALERAGARAKLFFDPKQSRAAIVTCGGLCPGLNNVIRSAFYQLHDNYGVPEVLGIRYGYQGLNPQEGQPPLALTGAMVGDIHESGGTLLGTSRGPQEPRVMVDYLQALGVNILLGVGGDGTQRGLHEIAEEALQRKVPLAVVGIPKTIDNDIPYVSRSFGFNTALERAKEQITGAHNEARGAANGIGLVKLMGRHAGFIAAGATLASGHVNFTLIPEVPFELEGESGLLARLERRLRARGHAVIVVAEGAGQYLLEANATLDKSGNQGLTDIGPFLKGRIAAHMKASGLDSTVKYFDPSYHIRSVHANCNDSLLCDQLALRAVHAAMAGKTDLLIGLIHDEYVHVPLPVVIGQSKRVMVEGDLWMAVLSATGQERW
jgi:6-phosphofructokinase 1